MQVKAGFLTAISTLAKDMEFGRGIAIFALFFSAIKKTIKFKISKQTENSGNKSGSLVLAAMLAFLSAAPVSAEMSMRDVMQKMSGGAQDKEELFQYFQGSIDMYRAMLVEGALLAGDAEKIVCFQDNPVPSADAIFSRVLAEKMVLIQTQSNILPDLGYKDADILYETGPIALDIKSYMKANDPCQ